MKPHPVTGEDVPDEADQVPVLRPVDPKPSLWPEAEFIIGNPPFIGAKKLRDELGDGYAEALWKAYPKVPKSADIALHFWWKAAQALAGGKLVKARQAPAVTRRFGFITSNSIRQVFCRRVVADALAGKPEIHLAYAIPDHPWTDGAGTAAVRIAMTVAEAGAGEGVLARVISEAPGSDGVPRVVFAEEPGRINAELSFGNESKHVKSLRANDGLASPGIKLHGAGFIVTKDQALQLGFGKISGLEKHILPYLNGRDLQQTSRGVMVIDMFGIPEAELRNSFPAVYQHLLLHVKPERDMNNRGSYREQWWVFGEPRRELRPALRGLSRYVATPVTSKHRVFSFVSGEILPDDALIAVASDDGFVLAILSSRIHVTWALASGGTLEDRPRYLKSVCFDPFPFPDATPAQRASIAEIAEALDAHRKARLAAHPHLTLTALYNCLEALRAGRALSEAERDIHDAGQVSILREWHDKLDASVAAAYGWPADLTDTDIIARLVALNAERVAEEARGQIRWLRPEFQAPKDTSRPAVQTEMAVEGAEAGTSRAWPKEAPAQYVALRAALRGAPASARDIARRFQGAPRRAEQMEAMLQTLVALGQARHLNDGRYTA
ncbi:MAG: hypothetical protein ING08_18790 [Roseomonas sp.]|nr:hypothetical protein [Roseomonas sp.]